MIYGTNLNHEMVIQKDGKVRLNLWMGNTTGFEDDGAFLIRDCTGKLEEDPLYVSTCTAINRVEYPYGEPEYPRGFFRSNAASIIYDSEKRALKGLEKIDRRIKESVEDINLAMDKDNHITVTEIEKDLEINLTYSNKRKKTMYLKVDLSEPLLLIKKHKTLGTICQGVVTPQELNTTGIIEGTDVGWRKNTAEFLIYNTLFADILEVMISGIEKLF